jgi:para-nitrobenzyl esterase
MHAKSVVKRNSVLMMLCGIIVCAFAMHSAAQITRSIPGDPIRIASGLVSGTMSPSGVRAYLGIPFAAPPVRENRWRAPQPVRPWDGVWTANRKPTECLQRLRASTTNQYFGDSVAGEDCLYLNVWAPADVKPGSHLPVVVYIYGGAFYVGNASEPLYAGEQLAKKGIIYIAANYRLGVMGFLAHPDASKESPNHASGNWGLLDQIEALKWVKANVQAFGGDPDNVTIVGQSAGAMSINHLQVSPLARGLFTRILAMSGSAMGGVIGPDQDLPAAEEDGMRLAKQLNAPTLAEMRTLPADRIFAVSQTARVRFGPIVDGYVIPELPDKAFEAGHQIDVPLLTGSTANDMGSEILGENIETLEQYRTQVEKKFGSASAKILAAYPAENDAEAKMRARQISENSGFFLAARAWATAQTRTGKQNAYLYLFARNHPFIPGVKISDLDPAKAGAYHTSDVPYWLGTYPAFNLVRPTREWTSWDVALSDAMQDVIVAFAKTGNPSTAKATFVPYNRSSEKRTVFGDSIFVETLQSAGIDTLELYRPKPAAEGSRTPPASATPAADQTNRRPD